MDPHGRWTLLDPLDALQGLPLKSGAAGGGVVAWAVSSSGYRRLKPQT